MIRLLIVPLRLVQAIRGCLSAVILFLLVLLLALCALLAFGVGRLSAAAPGAAVMLVVDESNSVWFHSDPDGLRVEAAELLIDQLGVDEAAPYRLGLVRFGSQAELHVPLTMLDEATTRRALREELQAPASMGWTDTASALALAVEELQRGSTPDEQRVILLLTDGRPETEGAQSDAAATIYRAALVDQLRAMVADGVVVHVVLLATDPAALAAVEPWWIEASEGTSGVHLHRATRAEELPALYHAIAATLRGTQSTGSVVDETVTGHTERTLRIEPGLTEVALLVRRDDPDLTVTLFDPSGERVTEDDPAVRVGRDGATEVWRLRDPQPGRWTVQLDGTGDVTIWQAVRRATASPSPTPTRPPTATGTPRATETATTVAAVVAPEGPSTSSSPTPPRRPPFWGLAASLLVALIVVAAVASGRSALVAWLHRDAGVLEGTLRLIAAPPPTPTGQRWSLEQVGNTSVTVGGAEAGVALPGLIEPAARLVAQRTATFDAVMLVPLAEVRLNDRPLKTPQALWDRDEIGLGPYRLRYENVQRRRSTGTRRRTRQPTRQLPEVKQ